KADEVEIISEDIEGWLVASNGDLTVALDVDITKALKNEGIARELVNRIQNLRKDSNLEVTDRIDLKIESNTQIEEAIKNNLDYIKSETLSETLALVSSLEKGVEVEFDDIHTQLGLTKHE